MRVTIPELSLVVLIGPSGCGKSSFARQHFKATEILSSDFCRGLVSDDENDQSATNEAFDVLHYVARKRLAAGRLTVVDATNVQPESRKPLVALAREFHVLPVAIVLNLPEKLCHERNQGRPDRQFGPHVVRNQSQQLRRSIRGLEREGFRHVFVLTTPEEVTSVTITRIREENATAAVEVMSRFAVNPKWLIYLPPTMSPSETSKRDGLLEHPEEAFSYFLHEGVHKVVCEQKHMGSRAVVVICREVDDARKRFGIMEGEIGVCYTRTGRRFFNDGTLESQFLERIRAAVDKAEVWEKLKTDWICLDCELMPWSAKAQELLRHQYAPTGAAAQAALPAAIAALAAAKQSPEIAVLVEQHRQRKEAADRYVEAYRRYCWPVQSLTDLKLAPFHLLASEGAVHTTKDHVWHMESLAEICQADTELLMATPFRVVDLPDPGDQEKGSNGGKS